MSRKATTGSGALRNDKLWSFNTLLNSMTMARFVGGREMGYEAGPVGKHGGSSGGVLMSGHGLFNAAREVLDAVRQLGENTPKTRGIAVLDTRKNKAPVRTRQPSRCMAAESPGGRN